MEPVSSHFLCGIELGLAHRRSGSRICALNNHTMMSVCFIGATRKLDLLYQGNIIIHGVPTVYQDGEGTSRRP